MAQLLNTELFGGSIRGHDQSFPARFTLQGLTRRDVERLAEALHHQELIQLASADEPAPHYWSTLTGGDHRVWFNSQAEYYREARAELLSAIAPPAPA